MNLIFGIQSIKRKNIERHIGSLENYLKNSLRMDFKKTRPTPSNVFLHTADSNKISGSYSEKNITTYLYGYAYGPVPDWNLKHMNPVDDPNKTAYFLYERYKKLGTNFCKDIYGHYIVIVYDKKRDELVIARDPHGQNDLFFYNNNGTFIFSNKLMCVVEALGNKAKLDRTNEDFFLTFGFFPNNQTMYESIKILPKSTTLTVRHGVKKLENTPYSPISSAKVNDENDLIDSLYEKLNSAIKNQLPSKKQKCAILLGGFDSALVASLISNQGHEVETFSFYYDDDRYNQLHTDTVANFLGIKHNWIKIDKQVIENGLKKFSQVFNRPTNWPSYVIQTAHLCEEIARRGFDYCYTGDGCDALFQGYPLTFKRAKVLDKIGKLLPNSSLSILTGIAARPFIEKSIGRPYRVGLGVLRTLQLPKNVRAMMGFRIFDPVSIKQLRASAPLQNSVEEIALKAAQMHIGKSSAALSYEGKKAVSPNKNKLNGSTDISGLLIASPYMHYEVSHFAQSIPERLLRPNDSDTVITGKYILSKMAEQKKLLPYDVIYQPKIGAADSPIEDWYETELDDLIDRQLAMLPFSYNKPYVDRLKKRGIFERTYGKLLAKSTNGIVTLSHEISLLMTYASFTRNEKER